MPVTAIKRRVRAIPKAKLQLVRQALQSLNLVHLRAPESPTAQRWQHVCVGESDVEGRFEIVSPQQTGKTAEYLADFFNKDQKQAWTTEFEHPMIESESSSWPMHCHTLSIKASDFIPEGIKADDEGARYCLLARNEQGRITSFSQFSISLSTFEDVFGEFGEGYEGTDVDDAYSFYLNIDLELIYTRARFRGRGAGVALLSAMTGVIESEISHICTQLAPVARETGVVFRMLPCVTSELNSRAGELAHNKLMEALFLLREFHEDMLKDEPVRCALEILEADDSETGY